MDRLTRLLNIQPHEKLIVGLLFVHSFFVGMPRNLGNAVATSNFAPELLPIVLMISAVLNTLVAITLNRLQARFSFLRFSQLNLTIQLGSMLIFFGAFTWASNNADLNLMLPFIENAVPINDAVAFVFFLWMQVIMVLSYKEFWDLAGRLFDIRQSKRLYGLIGAGEFLFIFPVGFVATPLTENIGAEHNLLLLAGLGVIGSFVALAAINKHFNKQIEQQSQSRDRRRRDDQPGGGRGRLQISRYVLLIFMLAGVYAVGFAFTRQLYFNGLELRFGGLDDPDAAKNAFILQLTAFTGLANLMIRLFVGDQLFERWGVAGGLFILPTLVLLSSLSLSTAYVIGIGTIAIFWLTIVLRSFYFVLKPSIDRPASLVLFQIFPADERQRLLTLRDGIVDPLAGFLGGVLLLLVGMDVANGETLAMVLGLLVALWLGVVSLTLRDYGTAVVQVLRQREVSAFSNLFKDRRNLERIKQNLESERPLEVIYALHVLQTLGDESLRYTTRKLLMHESDFVREQALTVIEAERMVQLLPQVMLLAQRDSDTTVRARAVRTMAVLGQDDVYDLLMGYLRSSNEDVRKNAMIGLLRSGDLQGVIGAGNALLTLSQSEQIEDRMMVADILGGVGNRNFYRLLLDLLVDDNDEVRKQALHAAGKIKNPKLWPLVIDNLQNRHTRNQAVRALYDADESVIPAFNSLLSDPDTPPRVLITVTRICNRLDHEAAQSLLLRYIEADNLNLRRYVLEALSQQNYRVDSPAEREKVYDAITEEVAHIAHLLTMIEALQKLENANLIVYALEGEVEQGKDRIFNWLSFVYESEAIRTAKSRIERANRTQGALILEALEQMVSSDLRPIIIPLFEPIPNTDRIARLRQHFPQQDVNDPTTYIHEMLRTDQWIDPWLQTTVVFTAPNLPGNYSEALLQLVQAAPSIVTETALWSLNQSAPTLYNLYVRSQREKAEGTDEAEKNTIGIVSDTIGLIRKVKSGGERVLLTIEKVLALREVKIFSSISEEFLADIAFLLEEVRLRDNDVLLHEGEQATHLYIVLDGVLEVRDQNGNPLAELAQYEIVGELSLFLDDPTHTADVVAKGQAYLLRLHRDDFIEILYDYSEVSHGLIRELAQRVHLSNQRLIEMQKSRS